MSQLDKRLKFTTFCIVVLYSVQSFLSTRISFNFRHLSSCDTRLMCNLRDYLFSENLWHYRLVCNLRDYLFSENLSIDAVSMSSCIATSRLVHNGRYVQKLLQLVNSFWWFGRMLLVSDMLRDLDQFYTILVTIRHFKLWKSTIMDQFLTFHENVYKDHI